MKTILNDVLHLSGEIANQESGEEDLGVTEFGEKLISSDDIEFLWVARNASGTAKKATTSIKSYSDNKISEDISKKGSIRLGNEVFVYSKSSSWKTNDLEVLVKWLVKEASSKEVMIEDLVAVLGKTFVPKLMGLDAVSKRRGKDPQMIRDTFLYKEWKDKPDLKTIRTESKTAPEWVQNLSHGERKK